MGGATGKPKFGLIADADGMMSQSANSFLKTLEDPPNGSLLLLLTSLPEALLETIRSRCVVLALRSPSRRPLGVAEHVLFDAVSQLTSKRSWTVVSSLALARLFQDPLTRCRDEIATQHDDPLKHVRERYQYSNECDMRSVSREDLSARRMPGAMLTALPDCIALPAVAPCENPCVAPLPILQT